MKTYDVLIIGAGPGGIFTAYELVTRAERPLKVGVFEMGRPLEKRKCPIDGNLRSLQILLHHERLWGRGRLFRRKIQHHQ